MKNGKYKMQSEHINKCANTDTKLDHNFRFNHKEENRSISVGLAATLHIRMSRCSAVASTLAC